MAALSKYFDVIYYSLRFKILVVMSGFCLIKIVENVQKSGRTTNLKRLFFLQTQSWSRVFNENTVCKYENRNLYQAEYKCYGPGAPTTKRAKWAKQLNDKEVAPFLSIDFIKGKDWLPAWS